MKTSEINSWESGFDPKGIKVKGNPPMRVTKMMDWPTVAIVATIITTFVAMYIASIVWPTH